MVNKSEVLKRAWRKIRGEKAKRENLTFSDCLKEAWDYFKSFSHSDVKFAELEGSEKQIKWANDIRQEMLNGIEEFNRTFVRSLEDAGIKVSRKESAKIVKFILANETSAKMIIDYKTQYSHWADEWWTIEYKKYKGVK